MPKINLIGLTIANLTVLSFSHKDKWGNNHFICRCFCGKVKAVNQNSLKRGLTKSCGCQSAVVKKHGNAGRVKSKEYRSWDAMKTRCLNPKSINYKYYGGKGVTICDRWLSSFENFISDMGMAPSPSHTVDRINGTLGYQPDNCRWATKKEQANNRSSNV